MKQFYSLAELAAANLPDLPRTPKSLDNYIRANKWRSNSQLCRQVPGKTKSVWEYHVSLLPRSAQSRLLVVHSAPANDDANLKQAKRKAIWKRFEELSKDDKAVCEERLTVLMFAADLQLGGLTTTAAMTVAARRFGISARTAFNWQERVNGIDRADWLAALAPERAKTAERSQIVSEAWEFLISDFLRPEKPAFSACYRRLLKAAKKHSWSPVPSERSLRRRLDAEIPEAVQVLARSGKDKAKALYPAQRRTRTHLHAMQAVNMDGHKFDVFVKVPWMEKPIRMIMLGIQDLFSGKVVAWRLSDSENKETVRLVIGDMVENFGIPETIFLDNGRAFASKLVSGGAATRYRFKVRDEEPLGLLMTLGIKPQFTTPYSGQSKPIERAWRDLAENIAKHPYCAGAYTGNKPDAKPENYMSRAVPLEGFRDHVARQVAEHNAQTGRTAENCAGKSFDETFEASMRAPSTIVAFPTEAQRSLWLLASELIQAKKGSGEIHYHGNRYWSRELNQHAGRKVTIRFDPDNLHGAVKVYDISNVLICEAPCIENAGFDNSEAARLHAQKRRSHIKATIKQKETLAALSAQQLADILYKGETDMAAPEPIRPTVTRLVRTSNLAAEQAAAEAISQDEFADNFSKAMSRMAGSASILQFPDLETGSGNKPDSSSGSQHEPKSSAYGSGKKKGGKNPAH
ncbi:transposase domain-containing protein [Rhizobium herbae]